MTELLAMTCDACGEPMLPNVSTLDEHGCLWLCINPRCPELRVEELEAGDLVEAGVPQALAGRLARLIDHYVEEREAPPRTRERAQAYLASLRAQLLEMGRLAETTGAIASHLCSSDRMNTTFAGITLDLSPQPQCCNHCKCISQFAFVHILSTVIRRCQGRGCPL